MNTKAEELKRRTAAFATAIIELCTRVPDTQAGRRISGQLIDAATALAANYRAACRARSKAEFVAKIGTATEEADECCGWLELAVSNRLLSKELAAAPLREANELTAILTASRKTAKRNIHRNHQ